MAENTILVLNISCILEHLQDKSFTEPISWGENMFGEKHSIHLQDQHSDPYHKYYRKKLFLIFNSLFFLFIREDFQSFSSKYINNRYNIPIDLFHSLHEHGPIKRFFYFHNTCRQKKNSTHDVYLISTLQDFHNTESTLNNASVSST